MLLSIILKQGIMMKKTEIEDAKEIPDKSRVPELKESFDL